MAAWSASLKSVGQRLDALLIRRLEEQMRR